MSQIKTVHLIFHISNYLPWIISDPGYPPFMHILKDRNFVKFHQYLFICYGDLSWT